MKSFEERCAEMMREHEERTAEMYAEHEREVEELFGSRRAPTIEDFEQAVGPVVNDPVLEHAHLANQTHLQMQQQQAHLQHVNQHQQFVNDTMLQTHLHIHHNQF